MPWAEHNVRLLVVLVHGPQDVGFGGGLVDAIALPRVGVSCWHKLVRNDVVGPGPGNGCEATLLMELGIVASLSSGDAERQWKANGIVVEWGGCVGSEGGPVNGGGRERETGVVLVRGGRQDLACTHVGLGDHGVLVDAPEEAFVDGRLCGLKNRGFAIGDVASACHGLEGSRMNGSVLVQSQQHVVAFTFSRLCNWNVSA